MSKEKINNATRAAVMIQALPYIHTFRGKTIVVKYGGNAMINADLKEAVMEDIVFMWCVGIRTILVHGGGPEIDAMLKKTGMESRFVDGLRYTDEETMEIVQMVLCGKVNKDITAMIQASGGRAMGLCGIDGAMLRAKRLSSGQDLGLVGEIESVDTSALEAVLSGGAIPVVSSVALGQGASGSPQSFNVNADTAAARIAAAMGAEKLILMTGVRGLLRDVQEPDSLISRIPAGELEGLKKDGTVSKGMIPKVDCCIAALSGGVKKAHIIDGRQPHALMMELFTDEGIGTMIE
jgi:acetylglutamate kinase